MNKKLKYLCAALTAILTAGSAIALAACKHPEPLTDEPLTVVKIADYTKTADDRKETFASGSKGYSWENGEPFNVWWKASNVSHEGGKMSLSLSEMTEKEQKWDEETETFVDCTAEYYGAEERSEHYYGFGDFSVRMKPAKITGTASTFFTCTGPYDKWYDEDGETVIKTNDHDEIDIEFLGKDTTKVQFNYFASGVGGHEYMYDLGFDASLEFHDYGFRWTEDYITWFVDNEPVYRVDRENVKEGEAWPEDPGRVIMNYWCGTETASAWMGEFNDDYTGHAEYEWAAASGTPQRDPNTAHIDVTPPADDLEVPTEGWTDISVDGFDGWGQYTVDKTDGLTISHDEAKSGYKCCGMNMASSYSWVKFNIKNNDAVNAADLRIDVKKESGTGGVEAVSPANDKVSVNAAESAVMIKLDAGEDVDVALKIKNMLVDQFVVFLNSMSDDSAAEGSITITDLKGIVNPDVQQPTPPQPNEDGTVAIDVSGFTGWGMYTVDKTDGITISHDEDKKGTYHCCGMDLSSDYGVIKFTVKNNSENGAAVKIDVKKKGVADGDNGVGGVSAVTAAGGDANNYAYWNDYDDSAVIVIAAGSELEITITVKDEVTVDQFVVFLNSIEDENASATGNISITDLRGKAKEVGGGLIL